MIAEKVLRPDSKGRITLGDLAADISSFRVTIDDRQRIVLEPYAEIPAREKWLFDNPEALDSVRRGLKESAASQVSERGSFAWRSRPARRIPGGACTELGDGEHQSMSGSTLRSLIAIPRGVLPRP